MFSCVRSGILAMTQGDIAEHVEALASGRLPASDPPMMQLKYILDHQEPQEHIVEALRLLRTAPCMSTLVEEVMPLRRC